MSFFARLGLAFVAFVLILRKVAFAEGVRALRDGTPRPVLEQPPALAPAPEAKPLAAPVSAPSSDAALHLLAALQREGRLVDFLEEDVAAFPDADVGAAARQVHEGCRKALRSLVRMEPVLPQKEGDAVTVPAGFDAGAIRLAGRVVGAPPFTGTLRHHGWRAVEVRLAAPSGLDPRVVAPAEVELA